MPAGHILFCIAQKKIQKMLVNFKAIANTSRYQSKCFFICTFRVVLSNCSTYLSGLLMLMLSMQITHLLPIVPYRCKIDVFKYFGGKIDPHYLLNQNSQVKWLQVIFYSLLNYFTLSTGLSL